MCLLTFLFGEILQVIGGVADKVKVVSVIFLTTILLFLFSFLLFSLLWYFEDKFWTVELALPFSDLVDHNPTASAPPNNKDQWRINFSRFA